MHAPPRKVGQRLGLIPFSADAPTCVVSWKCPGDFSISLSCWSLLFHFSMGKNLLHLLIFKELLKSPALSQETEHIPLNTGTWLKVRDPSLYSQGAGKPFPFSTTFAAT